MKRNLSFVLAGLLLVNLLMGAQCSQSRLVSWSDKASRYSARAATIVQGYVSDGSLPNGGPLVAKLNQFSVDAKILADAFRHGASNTVEIAANLTTALDSLLSADINLIPAGSKRNAVMIVLAVVDEALHSIADDLITTSTHQHHALAQQAEKTKAADTLRKFAAKPRLRCRDAGTGRFQKMEVCKAHPESTVVERVKPKD